MGGLILVAFVSTAPRAEPIADAVHHFVDVEQSWPLAQFLIWDARHLAVEPIENRMLELRSRHDEPSVRTKLAFANVLYEMGKDQIDAREEMVRFAGTHNDMIAALCDLANEPLANGNEDVTYVLTQSIRGRFDAFLSQLQREDLTTNGILNLLHVFDNWSIRDKELVAKIKATLERIVHRYKKEGYFWKWRWGTRRFSDAEENAVIHAAAKIRSKSLLK